MNDTALTDLIEPHRDAVRRFLLSLGTTTGDVDDAVQEVFLRACKSADGFRGESAAATWLFGIARHVAADTRRRNARAAARHVPLADAGDCLDAADGSPDHAQVLERAETSRLVRDALHQLPAIHREVLLDDAEGRSYREIAAARGIPVGTVRSRLHHARRAAAVALALLFAAACGRKAVHLVAEAIHLNRWGLWHQAARAADAAASDRALAPGERCGAVVEGAWAHARLGRDEAAADGMKRFERDCAGLPPDAWQRAELAKLRAEYTVGDPAWRLKRALELDRSGRWPEALVEADAVLAQPAATARQRCEALYHKAYALTWLGRKPQASSALADFDAGCASVPHGDWTRRETARLKARLGAG